MNAVNMVRVHPGIVLVFLLAFLVGNRNCASELAAVEWEDYEVTTVKIRLQNFEGIPDSHNVTGKDGRFTDSDWVPPGRLKEWFPVYRLGRDDDGVAST